MAIMIPSVISPDVHSNAEKRIFNWFKHAPKTDDWIILHSLGISNHKKVIHGEVDFFALIPRMGIFALEVKGGRVRRENGIWSFTDKYGRTNTKVRGPFDQAWEGIFSIKRSISKLVDNEHQRLTNIVFGIGVMFPDIEYSYVGVDMEPWQVFDVYDKENVSSFIKRVAEGAKRNWARTRGQPDDSNFPTVEDVKYLANLLRGDFDLVPLLSVQMKNADEELIALTREQYKCLDQLEDNPRCLVRGVAGTGKTLLAIEATKRAVANGERVAFFCFNRLLGNWLHNYFEQQPEHLRPLYVGTLHSYMVKILSSCGECISIPEEGKQTYYSDILPKLVIRCTDKERAKFDRIIVDEAQDVISKNYLDVIDSIISSGLEFGRWMMFGDLSMQTIYGNVQNEFELIETLEKRASFTKFKLIINCRNTKKICEELRTITGMREDIDNQSKIEGPPVQYITYSNLNEQLDKLSNLIEKLAEERIESGDITILSPYSKEKSVVSQLHEKSIKKYDIPKVDGLTFSTIHAFKGLENRVIILVDIDNLRDKKLLYVGLSRARTCLYVLESESANHEYTELFIKRRL